MQTIVYQCDTAMPAQKLPNCCVTNQPGKSMCKKSKKLFTNLVAEQIGKLIVLQIPARINQ